MSSEASEGPRVQFADRVDAQTEPAHVRLGSGPWSLWSWAGLRGAGFPVHDVIALAAPDWAASADEVLERQADRERIVSNAIAAVSERLDRIRADGDWNDSTVRGPLVTLQRDLRANKQPKRAPVGFEETVAQVAAASARERRAHEAYLDANEESAKTTRRAIQRLAADPRFQEAIIWQNRRCFHTCLDLVLRERDVSSSPSKARQHEELVASYVQRYCTKNDTIGFFGPVGWASIGTGELAVVVRNGRDFVSQRSVYFEAWGIDAVAEYLAKDPSARPSLAPRQMPYVFIDGEVVYASSSHRIPLPPLYLSALKLCDGRRSAREIAHQLVRPASGGAHLEADVYEALAQLELLGLVSWNLDLPMSHRPELELRRAVERFDDPELRRRGSFVLGELECHRDAIAAAAGAPEQLDRALGHLETAFERYTGRESTRSNGAMYAARTLVYEECKRGSDVELGSQVVEAIRQPLELLLTSARWVTYRTAGLFQQVFQEIHDELARKSGSTKVSLVDFWLRVQGPLVRDERTLIPGVVEELHRRWTRVLEIPDGARHVERSSAELWQSVQEAFAAPRPGWIGARYHAPDLMIDAESAEAIRRDDFRVVMGELHVAANTLDSWIFVSQHPSPDQLVRATERDLGLSRVVPVVPKDWGGITVRTQPALTSPKLIRISTTHDSITSPEVRTIPIGALVVRAEGGRIMCSTRDAEIEFDVVDLFSELLSSLVVGMFKILPQGEHTPRITVDRMVIARECWSAAANALEFAFAKSEPARLLEARRWARSLGMPRFVFVKSPAEEKPIYVDFDSPILINILAKVIRRSAKECPEGFVAFSEMLPRHDGAWLADFAGKQYTSEFRVVAVDTSGAGHHAPSPGSWRPKAWGRRATNESGGER